MAESLLEAVPLLARWSKNYYSAHVSGNWVIVFRFEDYHAVDVDYLDYH